MSVEVDAPAQENLSVLLASIREHYEMVATKNHKDTENWFQAKVGPSRPARLFVELLQLCSPSGSPSRLKS